jgi:transcriptional regulator with XRE-family HTH domain
MPKSGMFAGMKLDHYMTLHGLDDEAMASRIGEVGATGVRKWRLGERVPRPDQMRRIHEATGGEVEPNDFYGLTAAQSNSEETVNERSAA